MTDGSLVLPGSVHCRTGSLEIKGKLALFAEIVHCRTGSLEK